MTFYRSIRRYKYQTTREMTVQTSFRPPSSLQTSYGWVWLLPSGELMVMKGYAWDGPSGPSIDTENFMRGSLFRDALYQMLREGVLPNPADLNRAIADILLYDICREDGMCEFRAWYVWKCVRIGAKKAARYHG